MAEHVVDHQKRFQAAVDVIHNLPKNGSYQPSYEVMLRFYSLYKQAVCGPCAVSRPAFWDPVGRYKWDAWSRLGEMSSESAMAAYVDEMKKVAHEVINTMPMDEKTASLFQHFEPLYQAIDDMPRPPESLIALRKGHKGSGDANEPTEMNGKDEERKKPEENSSHLEELNLSEVIELTTNTIPNDSGVCEGLVLTSDSESETFCDSVDSVEQLSSIKIPIKSKGFQNGHVSLESSLDLEARQVGAGQGGEGAENGRDQIPIRRSRDSGQEGYYHSWRGCTIPQGSLRWGAPGGGSGAGRGGGDGPERSAERLHNAQLQQQIILALQRLREDMRSVMERLEVVESLAATYAQRSEWRPSASEASEQEKWWPFEMSGLTVLLLLVWPFISQGLVQLLRKAQKRRRISQ